MDTEEAIESYVNGNISHVKSWLDNAAISLGEFLEIYIQTMEPDSDEIVRFVKRLEQ